MSADDGKFASSSSPVATRDDATGPWPDWARLQLCDAVELATRAAAWPDRPALAPELYRSWFNPIVSSETAMGGPWRPLAGLYRGAHAGSAARILVDGVAILDRHDVIGRDGWWRTWGDEWRPTQSRQDSARLVMTPRPEALADFVSVLTAALLDESAPWMLACATDRRRLRRLGAAVLHLPDAAVLAPGVLDTLRPLLRPVTPPLCLPLAPGIGLADNPDNGMSFGEHRCQLIALALRSGSSRSGSLRRAPLRAIADVFASHGIDPERPHLSRP